MLGYNLWGFFEKFDEDQMYMYWKIDNYNYVVNNIWTDSVDRDGVLFKDCSGWKYYNLVHYLFLKGLNR